MEYRGLRNASRRLVIELIVVVLLAGVPVDFPRSTSTGRAWSFLLRHPSLVLHVVVGALILVEAAALLLRSLPGPNGARLTAAIGLVFAVLAVAAGIAYTVAGEPESALTLMSLGWLGALATFITGWVVGHRRLAAAGTRTTA